MPFQGRILEYDSADYLANIIEVVDLTEDTMLARLSDGSYYTYTRKVEQNTYTVNGVSFKMISVAGGTFRMGAQNTNSSGYNYDADAYDIEAPVHEVTLSDYFIGETEVTQELWTAVMGSNPSYSIGDKHPVEKVSWNDCQKFITKLNEATGQAFRLPTEAEWEFAARGGNQSKGYKYSGSNTIENVAWYGVNSYDKGTSSPDYGTHEVGTKQPNELGLYDMTGNVYEWCQDWYGSYSSSAQTNPTGASSGYLRVFRGGAWSLSARSCRVTYRSYSAPTDTSSTFGLRLAQ
ncbi:MAG: formylglycine-generating enzyme family protein [Bacteroidaceae bacterium]|nr:formylglycine-generating enzyme family protein [Bacteroidaceae bacterium]